jgi:GDP-L-fucose synthase
MHGQEKILILGADKMLGYSLALLLNQSAKNDLLLVEQEAVDWTSFNEVAALIAQSLPNHLICLLGKSGGIFLNQTVPADLMLDNLFVVLNVVRACHFLKIQRAIFLGASCMYPRDIAQPMQEQSLFSGYLEPTSQSYAVAKLASLQLCQAFNQQYGTHFIYVIPSTMYGPHDNFSPETAHVVGALINKFHQARLQQSEQVTLWGSGLARRELIYVDDVAQAIIRCLAEDITAAINPVNIGYGCDISIKELAELIAMTVGFQGEILWDVCKSDGTPQKCLDHSKLASLGWSARTTLERGLELTYQWYLTDQAKRGVSDQVPL